MDASRIRSLPGLVAVAVVLGVFTLSPVAAHFTDNTKHLANHAWQQVVKKKADKRYVQERKILSATVTNTGSGGDVRGRGVVDASFGFSSSDVEFNRAVHGCTWSATYESTFSNPGFAMVTPTIGNPKMLTVYLVDHDGTTIAGAGETFHLLVACP